MKLYESPSKQQFLSFGIDIGTNSCAICVTDLYNSEIKTIRNLVFPDSRNLKTKAPLNQERREKRLTRRMSKRHKMRKKTLSHILSNNFDFNTSILEKEKPQKDVYYLRARALDEKLNFSDLSYVIYNLSQRRGYKSNRLSGQADEDSVIIQGIDKLHHSLEKTGYRTFGEYLYHQKTKRIRRESDGNFSIFPDRSLIEKEFNLIWEKQSSYYPDIMSSDLKERIFNVIFYQRPLKKNTIGKCSYYNDEDRLHLYHPLSQDRIFFERINNLKIKEPNSKTFRSLSSKERDLIVKALVMSEKRTFTALKKELSLDKESVFNFENKNETYFKGHLVNSIFGSKKALGKDWLSFSIDKQWDIINHLINEPSKEFIETYFFDEYNIKKETISYLLTLLIPSKYTMIGETATKKIVDVVRKKNMSLHDVLCQTGLNNIIESQKKQYDFLPYYGEVMFNKTTPSPLSKNDDEKKFGKIMNPTVHVVLNIVRKMVNSLIKEYGVPDRIVVELSRDLKMTKKQKIKYMKKIKENENKNKETDKKLSSLKIPQTTRNRDLLNAYLNLPVNSKGEKACIYCANPIDKGDIFSNRVNVDHILPYSRSLDNSKANKILVHQHCNAQKGDLTPHEFWIKKGGIPKGAHELIKKIPSYNQWRFTEEGTKKADKKELSQRALNDTSYISKYVSSYLKVLFPRKTGNKQHLFVSNGQITSFLRKNWEIDTILNKKENKKTRDDHRHHGVDAAIISISGPSIINTLSKISSTKGISYLFKNTFSIPMPWESFKEDLKDKIESLIVVHKVDLGISSNKNTDTTSGEFFQEKNYSISSVHGKNDDYMLLTYRKDFLELTPKNIEEIVDENLKKKLKNHINASSSNNFIETLTKFRNESSSYSGIRHIRLFKSALKKTVRVIRDKDGNFITAKLVRGNARAIIWKTDNRYSVQIITDFDLNSRKKVDKPTAYSKKILTLAKNDLISLKEEDGSRGIYRVMVMSYSSFTLVKHNEAGDLTKRHNNKEDSFKKLYISGNILIKRGAYKIRATSAGKIIAS